MTHLHGSASPCSTSCLIQTETLPPTRKTCRPQGLFLRRHCTAEPPLLGRGDPIRSSQSYRARKPGPSGKTAPPSLLATTPHRVQSPARGVWPVIRRDPLRQLYFTSSNTTPLPEVAVALLRPPSVVVPIEVPRRGPDHAGLREGAISAIGLRPKAVKHRFRPCGLGCVG